MQAWAHAVAGHALGYPADLSCCRLRASDPGAQDVPFLASMENNLWGLDLVDCQGLPGVLLVVYVHDDVSISPVL